MGHGCRVSVRPGLELWYRVQSKREVTRFWKRALATSREKGKVLRTVRSWNCRKEREVARIVMSIKFVWFCSFS